MSSDPPQPVVRPMVAPPGGVMTREAGAVTGDLEVWLDPDHPDLVRVRYAGALDIYTVVGKAQGRDLDAVVAALTADPGVDEIGNPRSADLTEPPELPGGPADGAGDPADRAADPAAEPAAPAPGEPDPPSGAAPTGAPEPGASGPVDRPGPRRADPASGS